MLVLTRRPGESLQIGADIQVTIFSIRGNQVRVAISAPAGVRVLRDELLLSHGVHGELVSKKLAGLHEWKRTKRA